MPTVVKINKFDPLTIECPEKIITPVELFLPELTLTLKRFDLDGMIPNAPRAVSKAQMLKLDITTETPQEIPYDKFMDFIYQSLPLLKETWKIAQDKFDKEELLK